MSLRSSHLMTLTTSAMRVSRLNILCSTDASARRAPSGWVKIPCDPSFPEGPIAATSTIRRPKCRGRARKPSAPIARAQRPQYRRTRPPSPSRHLPLRRQLSAGHWRGIGKGAALPPGPKPAAGNPCARPAVGLAPAVAAARLLPGFAKAFGRMHSAFQTWTTLYAPAINSLVSASPDC
jgi:hypothetical protein